MESNNKEVKSWYKGFTVRIRGSREPWKALEKSGRKECRKTNVALVYVAGRGGNVRTMGVGERADAVMVNGQAWL